MATRVLDPELEQTTEKVVKEYEGIKTQLEAAKYEFMKCMNERIQTTSVNQIGLEQRNLFQLQNRIIESRSMLQQIRINMAWRKSLANFDLNKNEKLSYKLKSANDVYEIQRLSLVKDDLKRKEDLIQQMSKSDEKLNSDRDSLNSMKYGKIKYRVFL